MTHVCIIGAGTAGSVLALELIRHEKCRVTLIDVDRLVSHFNPRHRLDVEVSEDSFSHKFQTVGFGFGGTSNLWHGVLTRLDEEDYLAMQEGSGRDLDAELACQEKPLERYFGKLDSLAAPGRIEDHPLRRYVRLDRLDPKPYRVLFSPTRFRKHLRKQLMDARPDAFNLLEEATAISLEHKDGKIIGVNCSDKGNRFQVQADHYVVCTGALETPRLLLQSFSGTSLAHPLLGKGLMDHPSAILGELTLPRTVLYSHHGRSSLFVPSSRRMGFRIPIAQRRTAGLNHSLFFRPHSGSDTAALRQSLRRLIYGFKGIRQARELLSPSMLKVASTLALEKTGVGYLSRRFIVTAQFEQVPRDEAAVRLGNSMDRLGRRIPTISNTIDAQMLEEARHLSSISAQSTTQGADFRPFTVTPQDFDPGSHHSGTCRFGATPALSVVDMDLRYRGLDNLYVCDASVLPKIGNANLTLTLASLAARLAKHLSVVEAKFNS